ncbi:MAG: ElyC/SanA/YdcF family protein [Candidatus Dojkabacteria bacterium]|jgi:SanA protein|nr:ElyC/SanA/YdcF family protein [Candidatus Dojkabacteria bacterium]
MPKKLIVKSELLKPPAEKPKSLLKKVLWISVILLAVASISPFVIYLFIKNSTADSIYHNIEAIPSKRVAIVFGAQVNNNSEPSDVLRDRIHTAVELYNADKIEKIIMSGDNRFEHYDEPSVMVNYALSQGVPKSALQPDYAGRRTYDTCYRAKEIFDLDEAVLITQNFHLPRAVFTCNALGVKSVGLSSDLSIYPAEKSLQMRDIFASTLAVYDIYIRKPYVVPGEKIEI